MPNCAAISSIAVRFAAADCTRLFRLTSELKDGIRLSFIVFR